jgi:tRNA(Ile)-lysidine synthase
LAEIEGDWVVLAHHLNDQAETALFNLLRGTGLAGAAAMNECSGRLLRPWLAIGCDAIEHYARQSGLDWCEDESNIDNDFSRNFLRNAVFPLLEGRFPAAIKNIAGASSRFREALRLLDDLARLDLRGTDCFPVHVEILSELDEARGRNALRYLLANAGVQIPSEARLREVLRQMISAGPDRHPTVLFGRYNLFRHKRAIHLELAPDSAESR